MGRVAWGRAFSHCEAAREQAALAVVWAQGTLEVLPPLLCLPSLSGWVCQVVTDQMDPAHPGPPPSPPFTLQRWPCNPGALSLGTSLGKLSLVGSGAPSWAQRQLWGPDCSSASESRGVRAERAAVPQSMVLRAQPGAGGGHLDPSPVSQGRPRVACCPDAPRPPVLREGSRPGHLQTQPAASGPQCKQTRCEGPGCPPGRGQQVGGQCSLPPDRVHVAGILGALLGEDRAGAPAGGRSLACPPWMVGEEDGGCPLPLFSAVRKKTKTKNREGWGNPGSMAFPGRGTVPSNQVPGGRLQPVGGRSGPRVGASSSGRRRVQQAACRGRLGSPRGRPGYGLPRNLRL